MARAGARYPQVEPTAAALGRPVAAVRAPVDVGAAAALAARAGVDVLWLPRHGAVGRPDLERARAWRLGRLPAGCLARRGLPVLPVTAPEIEVRRRLHAGAPLVLLRRGRRVVAAADPTAIAGARPALVLTRQLEAAAQRGDPAPELLRLAGDLGERAGDAVYAAGGVVRDLLLGRPALDVDVVVEGDGIALARRLHARLGGRLTVHARFGTASIEGGRAPGGAPLPRVDVASARRERYRAPGALPEVEPADLAADLARRDFTVHAMALAAAPSGFGRLLDPHGGWADLRARRLRPLHPLSFVEDPTRVFRAARYAARLGLRLHGAGRAALALARAAAPYPALSGDRLRHELALIAGEPTGCRALGRLARWGALNLWDPAYRPSARLGARLRAARALLAWAGRAGVPLDPLAVALVAVLGDQRPAVRERCLDRLAVTGAQRRALAAMAEGPAVARLARRRPRPSRLVRDLERRPAPALVAAWLEGDAEVRRRLRWFWTAGATVRPHLTGGDLLALGVPRGREIGALLATLRQRRLDGAVRTVTAERQVVNAWLAAKGGRP